MAARTGSLIGIDFGTSTSFLATPASGIIPLGMRPYLPSIAGVWDRRLVVGEKALALPPARIIRSAKRAITESQAKLRVGGRFGQTERSRDSVIVAILKELRAQARASGLTLKAVDIVRMGCPATWTHEQRRLLLDLAKASGLPTGQAQILEEPVAAGINWLEDQIASGEEVDGRLLVFDMGGGTLDLAVMQVAGGGTDKPRITVLASVGSGDAGDALDDAIYDDLVRQYRLDLPSLSDPQAASQYLSEVATQTKIRLSGDATHDIFPNARHFGREKMSAMRYPRERLNGVFTPLMDSAVGEVVRVLRLARLAESGGVDPSAVQRLPTGELAKDVDFVLLIGGMSRAPLVRQRLETLLPDARIHFDYGKADEGIVNGLVSTAELNTINMYRPGFDFELVCPEERIPLYRSYTPLFTSADLMLGQSALAYRVDLPSKRLPRNGVGQLEVYAARGERVKLIHRPKSAFKPDSDGAVAAVPVKFGHYAVRFALYTDGRIHLTDGNGHDHEIRIEGWPMLIRPGTIPTQRKPVDPPVYYPFNKS